MQSGPNCKKLVEGSAPKSLKTRTMFCGCSIFLRQMRFRQWADMKETVMSDSCVLHAILAWRLSLFVKITTTLALAGRGLGAEPTNKLLQKLLTLHCLPQPFSRRVSVYYRRITNLWSVFARRYFSLYDSSESRAVFFLRHFFAGSLFPHSSQV